MSKVKETTKREERKSALEPYSKIKHLEQSFNDLKYTQKKKLSVLKGSCKHLTGDVQNLKEEIVKNQETIKDLHDEIVSKNEELAKSAKQQEALRTENKELKFNLITIEEKFTNLEVTYDQNIEKLRLENIELNEKWKPVVLNFEATIAALKLEMEDLKTQLARKDEDLAKLANEKKELEDSKNQIIVEQSYKIQEIERIFEQPLKRVRPQLSSASQKKVAPFSDQPSTSANASRPDSLPSARSTQNSQGTEASRKSIRRRYRERQIIKSPVSNAAVDSDSDSDISHHPLNFRDDINNNANLIVATSSTPAHGFGRLKRSYVQAKESRNTPESENDFNLLKRSRN